MLKLLKDFWFANWVDVLLIYSWWVSNSSLCGSGKKA